MTDGIKSSSTCPISRGELTVPTTLKPSECRSMQTAEFDVSTSQTGYTPKTNYRQNSNCIYLFKTKRHRTISQGEGVCLLHHLFKPLLFLLCLLWCSLFSLSFNFFFFLFLSFFLLPLNRCYKNRSIPNQIKLHARAVGNTYEFGLFLLGLFWYCIWFWYCIVWIPTLYSV